MAEPRKARRGQLLSAREYNRLLRLAKRRVYGPRVIETADGWYIPPDPERLPQRTVAITDIPADASAPMTARHVGYAQSPPIERQYQFIGPSFEVYPALGRKKTDYVQFIWTPPDPGPDMSLLVARYERGHWLLDLPTAGGEFVVVRAVNDPDARVIDVQAIAPIIEAGSLVGWEAHGEVTEGAIYPFQRAADYKGFLWPAERDPMTDATPVLPAQRFGGRFHVLQYVRQTLLPPDVGVPYTDCAPYVEAR